MDVIIIAVSNLLYLVLISYMIKLFSEDKIKTIREVTKSLIAKNINEYAETLPEDGATKAPTQPVEQLQDLGSVDENVLMRSLKEEYENIEG